MIADLLAAGTVAVAQLAPHVFSRLGDKRQHRLIALLAFVLRVVALASAHLLSVKGVHGSVGVDGDDCQYHIGRGPDPFARGPQHGQNLVGNIAMQRIHQSPEAGLHRQFGDFQDARQNRIASDETQLVEAREADVEPQHDSQHEPVQIHGPGNSLACHRLFHQGLEAEFLKDGYYRHQPAVGSQILTREIIGRGSIDFMGLRSTILRALFSGRFTAILFLVRNHLGDLLGGRFCEASTSQFSVLPQCSRGPQMVRYALAFRRASAKAHSSGVTLTPTLWAFGNYKLFLSGKTVIGYQIGTTDPVYWPEGSAQPLPSMVVSHLWTLSAACTPTALAFTWVVGATAPANETCSITSSPSGVGVTATVATTSGGNWLQVSLNPVMSPSSLTVSVNAAGLAPGSYNGTITLSALEATDVVIPVALTVVLGPSTQLQAAGGDAQTGAVGKALSNPLVVQVTGSGGAPLTGVPVAFAVTSGAATLSASSVSTASDGTASVMVTLGSSPGAVTVTATVAGLPSVQFRLTAVLPPTVAPRSEERR